jgi:peptidoglycan hydrolase-like protein with peptidoglycan-binding domain
LKCWHYKLAMMRMSCRSPDTTLWTSAAKWKVIQMTVLTSNRFTGDTELTAVLNGGLRLGNAGTPPFPAPVLSRGPSIRKVQQALIDIGYSLPVFGADGEFGSETGNAVVTFKADWHLSPRDPVIGSKTINALDKEMIALERPAPVPLPPPTPPPVLDPFGRTAAGLAKVPAGLGTTAAFGATGLGSTWLHLTRATVATDIADRINNPDGAQQGGNGLCTTAAFINVWAQDAPDAYSAFATTLFDKGTANIAPNQSGGGLRIQASNALRATDYAVVASRMAAKRFPVPSQADWMVMSAIRDSTNNIVKFTGDPDDWVSSNLADGASPFGDLDSWLRNAGAWTSVVDASNVLLTASLQEALALDPSRSRCLLNIDVGMLLSDTGRHTVVLRSSVTAADGSVTLKVWSWAGLRNVTVTQQKFEDTYYGANVAFF